jgi:hypothetical protein
VLLRLSSLNDASQGVFCKDSQFPLIVYHPVPASIASIPIFPSIFQQPPVLTKRASGCHILHLSSKFLDSIHFAFSKGYETVVQHLISFQITDAMQSIGQYFMRLRTSTTDTASFGIYPKWRSYVHSLSLWNCFLSLTLAGKLSVAVSSGGMDSDQGRYDLFWQVFF